ncbi:MAG: S-adenosyl-l-methionine hydroxide adenosyltransferase family protein [Phycisphaerae bacterium]
MARKPKKPQPIVTLLTDFGTRDAYVGAMKGVLVSQCPQARIIDISHDIPPQDVLAGAVALTSAVPYYPEGTVHVVVVDPGVGTDRSILLCRTAGQTVIAPDNGILSLLMQSQPLEAIHLLRDAEFMRGDVSRTFHGRDIFAPAAASIVNGADIRQFGPRPGTIVTLDIPEAQLRSDGSITGEIIYVDRFGNLVSNISAEFVRDNVPDMTRLEISCAGVEVGPLQGAYANAERGQPLAIVDSMDLLEIAVNCGSAQRALQARVGSPVVVTAGSR